MQHDDSKLRGKESTIHPKERKVSAAPDMKYELNNLTRSRPYTVPMSSGLVYLWVNSKKNGGGKFAYPDWSLSRISESVPLDLRKSINFAGPAETESGPIHLLYV